MHLFGIDPEQLNEEGEGEYPEEIVEENDDQNDWKLSITFILQFLNKK